MATFDTVEDFWALMNYISEANNIPVGTDYSLFKVENIYTFFLQSLEEKILWQGPIENEKYF